MNNKIFTHDECKGCIMYDERDYLLTPGQIRCQFIRSFVVHSCPCKNCIVKVMCTKSCEERSESYIKELGELMK